MNSLFDNNEIIFFYTIIIIQDFNLFVLNIYSLFSTHLQANQTNFEDSQDSIMQCRY